MPSQFFGLNIAYTGLLASNAGLNTTGNNIANVETKGYSRQQVSQQAYDALRTFTTYGCAGAGVETIAIERMRDEFYDIKYWNNNAHKGEYDVKAYYMKQVEDYFRDDQTIEGFNTIFNKMYDALGQLQSDASDVTKRTQFVGFAGNLATYFNNLYGNMEKPQADTNAEIKIKVDEMNSIAASIAALNKQINVIEVGGGTANELRDQRSTLLDQLSAIVDVEIKEEPVRDPNNPEMFTGANYFKVTVAGGQTLVDTNEYNEVLCVARESYEKINQTDVTGLYDLYWTKPGSEFDKEDAPKFNIYAGNLGGGLKALVQMRDGNNGENFRGIIESIGKTPDGKNQTVNIKVNAAYLQDIKKLNLSDSGGKINLGNQMFYYDSWTYNEATSSYEFVLSDNEKNSSVLQIDKVGKDASIGSAIHYQGIPYYMQQMNEWVRNYADAFNNILTGGGVDAYGDPAKDMFVANDLVNGGQFMVTDSNEPPLNGVVSQYAHSLYLLTAKNFGISKEMEEDSNRFPTHSESSAEGSSGEAKNDIVNELIDLKTNKDKMSFRGSSASEFLQAVLSDVTLGASTANLFLKNYTNVSNAIDTQRQSVSSVDNDEEALNLVKYQNSYTLSSKMIQVLTEVYDRLILSTGV